MSCRGRAEAFARRLHTRLRSLGTQDVSPSAPAPLNAQDLYYEFDLEYEGPSSPAEEANPDRNTSCHHNDSDCDSLYLDAEEEVFPVNQASKIAGYAKYNRLYDGALINNNSIAIANRNEDNSRANPPRENGHGERRLYSAICLDDCARRNSTPEENGVDEVDFLLPNETSPVIPPTSQSLNESPPIQKVESHCYIEISPVDLEVIPNGQRETERHDVTLEILSEEVKPGIERATCSEIEVAEPIEIPICVKDDAELAPTIITNEAAAEPEDESALVANTDESLLHIDSKAKQHSEAENETDDRLQRVRRCSSLKTGKTPPGTPGRKKIVRFADVLGLDLADVKTFMDDIPTIPKSAYLDLLDADVNNPPPAYPANGLKRINDKYIVPMFQPPRILPNFMDLLNEKYVCLETANVSEGATITICGSVRVRNLDFHKSVHVRYTMNGWKTYTDIQATYVLGSCDGFSDTFQFTLYAPAIHVGQKLEFAVRFQCKGCQYWDNNSGINYCYQCLPFIGNAGVNTIAPPLTVHPMENWHPSFY